MAVLGTRRRGPSRLLGHNGRCLSAPRTSHLATRGSESLCSASFTRRRSAGDSHWHCAFPQLIGRKLEELDRQKIGQAWQFRQCLNLGTPCQQSKCLPHTSRLLEKARVVPARVAWPSTNSKGQPLHDLRAGQPLADGHCGILICIQADLAFHPSWLGLPAHNSLEPCQLCGVHRSKLLCRPFPRLFTADEWQARFAAKRSPLFSEVPGLSGLAVQPDLMHTKHLGTDQYLLGSTLELLLRRKGWPALQACLANSGMSWPETGRFLRHLQPSSWQRKELAPKLKGRAVDIRACTQPLLQLWSIHAGSSREDLQLKMCLERSLQMDQCLQDHAEDLRLPQPVYENFLRATKELLRLYQAGTVACTLGQESTSRIACPGLARTLPGTRRRTFSSDQKMA